VEPPTGKVTVPVELIELLRLDGDPAPTPRQFSRFTDAADWLKSIGGTFPTAGYHRIRFTVRWLNGDRCAGRYAGRHPGNSRFAGFDISRQIRRDANLLVSLVPYHLAGQGPFELAERILQGELELSGVRPAPDDPSPSNVSRESPGATPGIDHAA